MKQTKKGTPVYCAFDKLVPLEKIIPNPRNPNTHPESQVLLLAKIVEAQGWRVPITISRRSGFIVRGHARLLAAQLLDEADAPVDFQDYASEAEEWADLIADNRLAELAETDNIALKDLLQELDTGEMDMDLTGYTEVELERLMTQYYVPDQPTGFIDDILDKEKDGEDKEGAVRDRDTLHPSGGDEYSFAITLHIGIEQRDIVLSAIKKAKDECGCERSSDAIAHICRTYTEGDKQGED